MPASSPAPPRPLAVLLRFISCGVLSVAFGAAWRFTIAPARVGIGGAFAGIFFLLLGFIVGGIAWYIHDVRLHARAPERMSDERVSFSLVVFALVPFVVLVVIGIIWLLALVIGVA
jgi:hypothetical protein